MIRAPWDRQWLKVNPEAFERMVVSYLRSMKGDLTDFTVNHRTAVDGPDGEFEIDALAQFQALGAEFLILIECKHHKNPVKRELVQVLRDRVRSVSAQKGMLFATGGFQKGAIEYALSQRIALVHFTEGGPTYETRAGEGPTGPNRPYDAYFVCLNDKANLTYSSGAYDDVTEFLCGHERID
jgi:restriction system protein